MEDGDVAKTAAVLYTVLLQLWVQKDQYLLPIRFFCATQGGKSTGGACFILKHAFCRKNRILHFVM